MSTSKHTKNAGTTLIIEDNFTYDHMDRMKRHTQKIGGQSSEELITENEYDAMGQLVTKKVGGSNTATTALQDVDYEYNIRGWLTGINDNGAQGLGADLFSFGLGYNETGTGITPLYNGNISRTQ